MEDNNQITYFAETDFRNKKTPFGIKASDRTRHIYIIGKTGMGKSTLLENMAAQDLKNGNGMAFIDPHGSAVDTLLNYVPANRIEDVIYFSPADVDFPIAFNVMEDVGPEKRHLVAQGLLSSFKKIWGEDTFSDRMEHITNNTLLALLEYPDSTMLSIPRMFVETDFQKKVVANITDPSVKAFWEKEYGSWDDRYKKEAYAAVLNKIGQFTSNPVIRNIVGQAKSSFDFRKVMDEKKILLINLSIGQIGESNANLLGSMMTTKIFLAAMSRADANKAELSRLPNFYLYIDEFQNLANDSFADILSQARKYKLNLTMAHQYIEQMPEKVRSAVFGNVGSMIVFRVGSFDSEIFEKEFAPVFTVDDIVNLGFAQIYLRLMIDGVGSAPFSATTLPPIKYPDITFRQEVLEASRKQFAVSRDKVEQEIKIWHETKFGNSSNKSSSNSGKQDVVSGGRTNVFQKTEKRIENTENKKTFYVGGEKSDYKKQITERPNNFIVKKSENNFRNNNFAGQNKVDMQAPPLGKNSLKEALSGALKERNSNIPHTNFKDLKNEIDTANKEKLRSALKDVLAVPKDISSKIEDVPEKKKVKEIPESVLRHMLGEDGEA